MTSQSSTDDHHQRQSRFRIPRKWVFRAAVVVGLLAAGAYFLPKLRYAQNHETTDDAYVTGTVVPISPQLKGRIAEVFVTDNQQVAAGAPLLRLDPAEYRLALQQRQQELAAAQAEERKLAASLDEARQAAQEAAAELRSATSTAAYASREKERYAALETKQVVARRLYEQVANQADQAEAKSAAARAARKRATAAIAALSAEQEAWRFKVTAAARAVDLAQLDLDRTLLRAPAAGRVAKKSAEVGKFVNPGQTVLTLVDDSATVDRGQLQGDPDRPHPPRPKAWRCASTPTPAPSFAAGWRACSRGPARPSPCCRRKTPPATSSRWCSGCR